MLAAVSKAFFHTLAASKTLKTMASRYGMRDANSFARRFIPGEKVDEAIAAAREIERKGMLVTLDYLGESISTIAEAEAATRAYITVMDRIVDAGIGRNVSLKLTQLGLDVDRAICVDNLRRILDVAQRGEFFVRIDMEGSPYTGVTLDVFETIWGQDYRNVGVVLQACLHRTDADAQRINRLGARIRLVKGAYKEPKAVAYQDKDEVNAAFVKLMRMLLIEGTYPAIATHDPEMIDATREFAVSHGLAKGSFEFQMLYGIRRDLQTALTAEGFPFRVYIPFGQEWFPYFMRRLGERPSNVLFVVGSILRER